MLIAIIEHGRASLRLRVPVSFCVFVALSLRLMPLVEVRFIADDKGEFSEALGLTFDATAVLGTHRSHVS